MGSFFLTLKCEKLGLEKKIEFVRNNFNDPTPLPTKGVLLKYEDTEEPQFNGTYKVKKIIGNTHFNGVIGDLKYTLELKKIK